jgi:hypothetical protein
MAIINQFDKRTGVTYVYESRSVWVPELKQSRAKRTLIGKRDPETGEIIATAKRGKKDDRNAGHNDEYHEKLKLLLRQQKEATDQLNKVSRELDRINSDLNKLLNSR